MSTPPIPTTNSQSNILPPNSCGVGQGESKVHTWEISHAITNCACSAAGRGSRMDSADANPDDMDVITPSDLDLGIAGSLLGFEVQTYQPDQNCDFRLSLIGYKATICGIGDGTNIPPAPRAPWHSYLCGLLGVGCIYAGFTQKAVLSLVNFLPFLSFPALPWVLIGAGSFLVFLALYRIAFHIALGYFVNIANLVRKDLESDDELDADIDPDTY